MKFSNLSTNTLFTLIMAALFLLSCEKENEDPGQFSDGVFIVNEGSFGNSNASVSFYSSADDAVTNNIFSTVNGRDLGDVAQSLAIHNDKAYIVVNNSNKIEIVDKNTFREIALVPDLPSPRYFTAEGNKGYVSCWGDNSIKVINLDDYSIEGSIAVGAGPEKMLINNDKLYVTNTGGWSHDSIVSIIDLESQTVIRSLVINDVPCDIEEDPEGNIWVLAAGKVIYAAEEPWPVIEESPSMLYKIDPQTDEVVLSVHLFAEMHPRHLAIDDQGQIFFGGGFGFSGIYYWDAPSGTTTVSLAFEDAAYGFDLDPISQVLYVMNAPTFTDAGILNRYDTEGILLGSYACGIGPNSAAFKNARQY